MINRTRVPLSAMRAARLNAGLSAQVLATRAGLCLATVLMGERAPQIVTERTLSAVAGVLGVPAEQLRGYAANAKAPESEREPEPGSTEREG